MRKSGGKTVYRLFMNGCKDMGKFYTTGAQWMRVNNFIVHKRVVLHPCVNNLSEVLYTCFFTLFTVVKGWFLHNSWICIITTKSLKGWI